MVSASIRLIQNCQVFFLGNSYEAQLSQEKDVLLRIKGENGIMKKKLAEFHKDLEVQREEIGHLFQQKKELYEIIAIFERDMMCDFLQDTCLRCLQ